MPLRPIVLLLTLLCTCHTSEALVQPQPRALIADLAWWNRQLVEQYRTVGEHGPWDAAAGRFLNLLPANYLKSPPYAQPAELSALGMAVLEDGCHDPLMILRTAMFYDGSDYGRSLINWASDLLHKRRGTPKAYGTIHLLAAVRRQLRDPDQGRATRARAELPDLVRELLAGGLCDEATRDTARRNLSDVLGILVEPDAVGEEAAAVARKLFADPTIDPWLGTVLLGQAEIALAWQARGNGWGKDVTAEGQAGFREHLAAARRLLSAAWKQRPDLARAPALMVTVAMGDRIDRPQEWAERAWVADPECELAYDRLSNASLPRWGGTHEALLALAMRAAGGPWDGPLPRVGEALVMTYFNDIGDGVWVDGKLTAPVSALVWPILSVATAELPGMPAAAAAIRRTRRIAWLRICGRVPEALAVFTAAGGLEAPWLEPGAVPWIGSRPSSGPKLALDLRRMIAGTPPIGKRPLPQDPAIHRNSAAPSRLTRTLMPDWYARYGTHGEWDAQAAVLLGPMLAHTWGREGKPDPAWPTPAAVLTSGCPDALVAYVAHALAPDPDQLRNLRRMDADWQALDASPHPALAAYQPAWNLLHHTPKGPERNRFQERYAQTVALVAKQAGERFPLTHAVHELIQLPDADPGSLSALSHAASQLGVDPVLADTLQGYVELRQSLACSRSDPQRRILAWRALAKLWRGWDATRDPLVAAEMSLAAGLAKCTSTEIRVWFDHAVDGAMARDEPWNNLLIALAVNAESNGLVDMAKEISELPASAGCHHRALPFLLAVVGNRSLHDREMTQRIWDVGERVTSALLAAKLSPEDIRRVLHQRAAYAFLAGRRDETTAAVTRLGATFTPTMLPAGIDRERFQRETKTDPASKPEEQKEESKGRPSDF